MPRIKGIPNRNYPPLPLRDGRRVVDVMQEEASGMVVSRLTLAELLETTPASSVFKELVATSRFYGLTEGGINAEEFSVTELGERVASADPAVRNAALKEAVMRLGRSARSSRASRAARCPAPSRSASSCGRTQASTRLTPRAVWSTSSLTPRRQG